LSVTQKVAMVGWQEGATGGRCWDMRRPLNDHGQAFSFQPPPLGGGWNVYTAFKQVVMERFLELVLAAKSELGLHTT